MIAVSVQSYVTRSEVAFTADALKRLRPIANAGDQSRTHVQTAAAAQLDIQRREAQLSANDLKT